MKLITSIQFISVFILLCLSTLAAFYEGSAIRDNSFEWGWSTPFTMLTTESISDADQLSKLDYLVYAAKFQPLFPAIMLICVIYILILANYIGIKNYVKPAYYFSILACVMAAGCLMVLSDHIATKYIYAGIFLTGFLATTLLAIRQLKYPVFNKTN